MISLNIKNPVKLIINMRQANSSFVCPTEIFIKLHLIIKDSTLNEKHFENLKL
jgi:hypothetical protein